MGDNSRLGREVLHLLVMVEMTMVVMNKLNKIYEDGDEFKVDGGFDIIIFHLVAVKEAHDTEENHDGAVKAETVHFLHKDLTNSKE